MFMWLQLNAVAYLLNAARAADRNDKKAIFKSFPPLTDCISEINNTQVDNAKDLHVVMQM